MNSSRVIPLLALIVAANIFFFYIDATWSGPIATVKAAIDADNKALLAATNYSNQQNQLAAARDAIDPKNLTALSNLLPSSVDNVHVILDLNALAARSQLSIANIDVMTGNSSSPSGNPVGSVDLSLTASGTFSALQTFLSGVEKSARLLDVQNLVVKGSDTGVYTYQMTIRLYWLH